MVQGKEIIILSPSASFFGDINLFFLQNIWPTVHFCQQEDKKKKIWSRQTFFLKTTAIMKTSKFPKFTVFALVMAHVGLLKPTLHFLRNGGWQEFQVESLMGNNKSDYGYNYATSYSIMSF